VKGIPVSIEKFIIVMSAVLIMIGGFTLLVSLLGAADSMQMAEWPSTQGIVTGGYVDSYWYSSGKHISDGYYIYSPKVSYSYNVSGVEYSCDSVWRLDHESRSANEAQSVVNTYPSGMAVTVYYNPSNPSHAILDRTEGSSPYIPVAIGAALLALGIIGLVYAVHRQRKAL
jgi:hypothetical protein